MGVPQAVIEIGSTGIRLLVAEIDKKGNRNILDHSELPVALGRDVFMHGFISNTTQQQCVDILLKFAEQIVVWGIVPADTNVIATSAFRDAKNRDPVVDHIKVRTGFTVRVIDGIEENRLTYLAVTECLEKENLSVYDKDTMIIEVGGGSTELMLILNGKMAGAHSLKLGAVRIERQLRSLTTSVNDIERYIEEFVRNTRGSIESELNLSGVKHFIAVGMEAVIAALFSGERVSPAVWRIERKKFDKFVEDVQSETAEERAVRFHIPLSDAQTLHVTLFVMRLFLHLTGAKTILVPETNIRHGLVISKNAGNDEDLSERFNSQIVASAMNLLRKYRGDESHAEYVRNKSLLIYDLLEKELALSKRARLLLEVSAILHDIGTFIRLDDHNLHGAYIIRNSEIFGLTKYESRVVAEITKYHRGKEIPQDNEQFQMLSRTDRMTILKLTAIMRVADALDRGHTQGMIDVEPSLRHDALVLRTKQHATVLEKIALYEKADMFETVFGYKLVLE